MKTEKEVVELCNNLVDTIYGKLRFKNEFNYSALSKEHTLDIEFLEKEIRELEFCDLKKSYNNARINDTLQLFKKDIEYGTSETKNDFRETILTFITEYYDNKVNKNADRKQHLALFIIDAINYFTKKDLKIDDENKGKLTTLKF